MWILKTPEGADPSFTFRISPGSIKTIGRSTGAEFMVDAAMISRLHCRLSAGATELEVVDLESTNGTIVNGTRVDRAVLKDGDTLGVGRVSFIVSRASNGQSANS
ncbi:MAG TPA: FHA domain-containing protein [Vicinamibacterales bacterium]